MKTNRSLIIIGASLFLAACGSDHSDNQPTPSKPEPLQPNPTQSINLELDFANITALRESVVVDRIDGQQILTDIDVFKGIPFANADRFEHSQLHSLEGSIDATEFGSACPQLKKTAQSQSEACLNLNLWRPANTQAGDDLPVYVYIHGGDFEYGSGSEALVHGDTVVAQSVDDNRPFIMVTLNYRLGVLGSHWVEGKNADGNYGIGDQKRALEWVQEYVNDFGGDASNVTVMGQGAGAMSIGLLQQQMLDDDLPSAYFQRAIMQSNPYGFEYRDYLSAKSQDDSLYLKNTSLEEVFTAQANILSLPNRVMDWLMKNSAVKQKTPMSALMPFSPYMVCKSSTCSVLLGGERAKQPYSEDFSVPTVLGMNAKDSSTMTMLPRLTFLIPKVVEILQESQEDDLDALAQQQLATVIEEWLNDEENRIAINNLVQDESTKIDFEMPDISLPNTAYSAVSQLFFGVRNTTATSDLLNLKDFAPNDEGELSLISKNMSQFSTMMNDMLFSGPNRMKAKQSDQAVTLYHFSYKPSFNVRSYNTKGQEGLLDIEDALKTVSCISGACNGSELPFVFNKAVRLDGTAVSPSKKDKALMNNLSRFWFSDELFDGYEYEASSDNVLVIDEQGEIGAELYWDSYTQAGEDPLLSQGRLNGLEETDILVNYFVTDE
ncbi:carboxylesterase family protein [Vibrio splendidus]